MDAKNKDRESLKHHSTGIAGHIVLRKLTRSSHRFILT